MAYYGYRYYDPATGRWLSRDPINEIGGPTWFDRYAKFESRMNELDEEILGITEYFELSGESVALLIQLAEFYTTVLRNELYSSDSSGFSAEVESLYAFVKNNPIGGHDILGLAAGGKPKRYLPCEGFDYNSDPKKIKEAAEAAKAAGKLKSWKNLMALYKVVSTIGKRTLGVGLWWSEQLLRTFLEEEGCCRRQPSMS